MAVKKQDRAANDLVERTNRFKCCLAAAAPALVPLVILISTDALTMLKITSLDRLGLLAASVVFITLSYLLWKRRWWAGLPALAIFTLAALIFAWKAFRPLWAYYSVNAFNGPAGGFEPLLMISPALVMILLAVLLGRLVFRGIRSSLSAPAQPITLKTWGVLFIWVAVLIGDAAYQEIGWQYVKNPSDLVLRLCLEDPKQQQKAEKYLVDMGEEAFPALLQAVSAPGPTLACLRMRSKELLLRMGLPVQENSEAGLRKGD